MPRLVYSAEEGSRAFSMDQTIAPASSVTVTPSARVSTFASPTADGSLMQIRGLRSRTGLGSKVHRTAGANGSPGRRGCCDCTPSTARLKPPMTTTGRGSATPRGGRRLHSRRGGVIGAVVCAELPRPANRSVHRSSAARAAVPGRLRARGEGPEAVSETF